jgi:hypothetical protein
MKRVAAIGAIALALSSMPVTARASHVDVKDANDARGVLDVRRVKQWGSSFPKWNVSTFNTWSRRRIWDQGYIAVYLDTFGTRRHDYYALVWAGKDKMRAALFRDRKNRSDYAVTALKLRRPSNRSVRVTVNLKKLKIGADRATYNWYVQTLWSSKGCPNVCFDWAPDIGRSGGGIEEPLPLSL